MFNQLLYTLKSVIFEVDLVNEIDVLYFIESHSSGQYC